MREALSCCALLIDDMTCLKVIFAGIPHGQITASPISALQGINDAGIAGYTAGSRAGRNTPLLLPREHPIPGASGRGILRSAMHDHTFQYGRTEALASWVLPHPVARAPAQKHQRHNRIMGSAERRSGA